MREMRKCGVTLGALGLVMLFASTVLATQSKIYINDRFGYSIVIPPSFRWGVEAENGDGCEFIDSKKGITLRVYGHYNNGGLKEEFQSSKESAISGGYSKILISGMSTDRRSYILKSKGKKFLYKKIIWDWEEKPEGEPDVIATAELECPLSRKKEADEIFEYLINHWFRF